MNATSIARQAWTVDDAIRGRFRINEGEVTIAELMGTSPLITKRARLIAAAPGLLKALQQLLEDTKKCSDYQGNALDCEENEGFAMARAAIAEATGD